MSRRMPAALKRMRRTKKRKHKDRIKTAINLAWLIQPRFSHETACCCIIEIPVRRSGPGSAAGQEQEPPFGTGKRKKVRMK